MAYRLQAVRWRDQRGTERPHHYALISDYALTACVGWTGFATVEEAEAAAAAIQAVPDEDGVYPEYIVIEEEA